MADESEYGSKAAFENLELEGSADTPEGALAELDNAPLDERAKDLVWSFKLDSPEDEVPEPETITRLIHEVQMILDLDLKNRELARTLHELTYFVLGREGGTRANFDQEWPKIKTLLEQNNLVGLATEFEKFVQRRVPQQMSQ